MKTRTIIFPWHVRRVLAFCLLVVLFSPDVHSQKALDISPALSALIQQADQTYARRTNQSIQYFFDSIPINAAVIMGLAMYGQKRIVGQNPRYLKHYEALRQEAHKFLGRLAQVHNFRNPYDGQPMNQQLLANIFDNNASGEKNQWAIKNGLPDPAFVQPPLILNLVSPESRARLHLRGDTNEIRLLDQVTPPVPYREPTPQPGPPLATQPVPQKRSIAPEAILGAWQLTTSCSVDADSPKGNFYVEFRRGSGRDLYVGAVSGGSDNDIFRVRSERQIDPFTIEYQAVWENPHGQALYLVHGKTIKITVYRGRRNQLLLCRGGAGGVMSNGYLKVGN